ncbi:MAG: alpha/beta hydrolase [Bacteroidetes bacterium]|nr:alpha/beta hydrolase [Bacteroidota bacterium]
MKLISFVLQLLFLLKVYGQNKPINVYIFPGTGSDERLFSKLVLPENYTANYIQYSVPDKHAKLREYAELLSEQIDTTKAFVLIGVSVGGMICTELTDLLKPEKTIIISSSKCRQELPRQYRFQKYIPINKLFGPRFIKGMSFVAQAVVEPDRNKEKAIFKAMLHDKNPKFLKRTVNMIINWDRRKYSPNIIHIHGTKDHTLPLRNINPSIIIQGGSHMMTLTEGEKISGIVRDILLGIKVNL